MLGFYSIFRSFPIFFKLFCSQWKGNYHFLLCRIVSRFVVLSVFELSIDRCDHMFLKHSAELHKMYCSQASNIKRKDFSIFCATDYVVSIGPILIGNNDVVFPIVLEHLFINFRGFIFVVKYRNMLSYVDDSIFIIKLYLRFFGF